MKYALIALLLSFTATMAVADQHKAHHKDRKHHEMKMHMMTPDYDYLAFKLGLDENQLAEVKNLHEQKQEKQRNIAKKMREEMQVVRKEYMEQLRTVLTDEQLQKYKSLHGKPHGHHEKEVAVIKFKD